VERLDLAGTSFLRQLEGMLFSAVPRRGAEELRRRSGGFAKIEQSLVNGMLPDPGPEAVKQGWMATYHWDFAVYAQSNPRLVNTGELYSGHTAAINYSGLFSDLPRGLPGINGIKKARCDDLLPVLERCGIFRRVDGPYQNEQKNLKWKQLLLAPTWPATSKTPLVSEVAKTPANLEAHKRPWFMMPKALFYDDLRTFRSVGGHRDRRVLTALYCFYEAHTYAAVNPNHLRLCGNTLKVSRAFLKACGHGATVKDVASTLAWLQCHRRVFVVGARLETGTPYPAGESCVTWAEPVARKVDSGTAVFVPLYVPGENEWSQ